MKRNFVVAITGASGAVYAVRLLDVLVAAGCDVQLAISPAGQAVLRQELGIEVDLDEFRLDSLLPTQKELATHARFEKLRALMGVDAWQIGAPVAGGERREPNVGTPHAVGSGPGSTVAPAAAGYPRLPTAVAIEPGRVRYHHYQNFFADIASGSSLTGGMVVCPCSGGTMSAIAHGASGNLIHRAADVHLKEGRKLILVPRETPLSLVQLDNMRRCCEAGAVVLPAMPGFYHGVSSIRDLVDFVVGRICDQLGVEQCLTQRWGS